MGLAKPQGRAEKEASPTRTPESEQSTRLAPWPRWQIPLAVLVCSAVAAFSVLMARAIIAYPGGHLWDVSRPGYDFWRNFWCDLLREQAYNGSANSLAPPLAHAAMMLLAVGIVGCFVLAPTLFRNQRRLGLMVSILGAVAGFGLASVTWSSSGRMPWLHGLSVLAAGPLGLTALVGTLVGIARAPGVARLHVWLGVLVLLVSLCSLVQYARELIWHVASSPMLPLSQKVATVLALSWMCSVSARAAQARLTRE